MLVNNNINLSTNTTTTSEQIDNPYQHITGEYSYENEMAELDLLKIIVRFYLSNVLRFNGKLVLKNDDINDLIKFITHIVVH